MNQVQVLENGMYGRRLKALCKPHRQNKYIIYTM